MNDQPMKQPMVDQLRERIEHGELKMRPKSYFILRGIGYTLIVVVLLLAITFLVSLIHYDLHHRGLWYLPNLGSAGWNLLLRMFPWTTFTLLVVLFIALRFAVFKMTAAYRYAEVGVFLLALVVIGLITLGVIQMKLHPTLIRIGSEQSTPLMKTIYPCIHEKLGTHVHVGRITEVRSDQVMMIDSSGEQWDVEIGDQTRLINIRTLDVGAQILVVGVHERENRIVASGIYRISEQDLTQFSPHVCP
jgi:hypothetical protein